MSAENTEAPAKLEKTQSSENTPGSGSEMTPTPGSPVPLGPKTEVEEFLPGKIWTKIYYVRYAGATFTAKTTVIKLANGKLMIHSPGGPLDEDFKTGIEKIGGEVAYLIAPGDFHHLKVPEWQMAYPDAKTYICPGLDTKRKDMKFDAILKDEAEPEWKDEIHQVTIVGRVMSEVLFFHIPSATLIVTDMVEFITDDALKKDGTAQSWGTWFWVNAFRMKNRALMAPEYRAVGFPDKLVVKTKLDHVINEWKPANVIVNHGENMTQGAESIKAILQACWSAVLGKAPVAPAPQPEGAAAAAPEAQANDAAEPKPEA